MHDMKILIKILLLVFICLSLNSFSQIETKIIQKNDSIKEVQRFLKGKKHGMWLIIKGSTDTIAIAKYKYGNKDGEWRIWDNNKILRYEIFYKNGRKIGVWKMYNSEGNLIEEKDFNN